MVHLHAGAPLRGGEVRAGKGPAAGEVFRLLAEHLYVLSTVSEAPVPFVYSKRFGNISVAHQRGYYETTASNYVERVFSTPLVTPLTPLFTAFF